MTGTVRISRANGEMIDVMWSFAKFGADVKGSILLEPTLIGAQESAVSRSKLGHAFLLGYSLFRVVDWQRTFI